MTKILAYTSPARGHLFPAVPMLAALRARGHEIAVRTLAEHGRDLAALGLDARPLAPAVVALAHDDWQGRSPADAQQRAMRVFERLAPEDAADLRAAIADETPDLLLVDLFAFGALAVAEASGLPWGSWLPSPAWLRGEGIPPYGPGLAPLRGPAGRARDAAVAEAMQGVADRLVAAVNVGRALSGLERLVEADDVLLRPPLLIYFTAEPFEYPRPTWPVSFRLVGPCAWEPAAAPPAWLDEEDGRPLVLVVTSSEFQDDGRLVAAALAAMRERNDLRVVATLPAAEPASYDRPANARVLGFVPHAPLLPRAAVLVCHGGMGITQKALASGVPVCAVPFGRDQFEVARRVAVAGAGVSLPASELSVERLRGAIGEAMACRAGAARIADAFAAAGGAVAAADAVDAMRARSMRAAER
jgi:MGT family glycosyltransferase